MCGSPKESHNLTTCTGASGAEGCFTCSVCDSLLLELTAGKDAEESGYTYFEPYKFKAECPVHKTAYEMEEPNVLLLDRPAFSFNGEPWHEPLDVLKIEEYIYFKNHGQPYTRKGQSQPWQVPLNKNPKDVVSLRFTVESDIEYEGAHLALEYPEFSEVIFNGEMVPMNIDGHYVDEAIVTIPLPRIKKGENELLINLRHSNADKVEA